jgi:hypothetical protein
MLLNAYLICLRCTQGSTIKRTVQVGRSDESVRGSNLNGKIPFPLMTKGERFIRCRGQRHGSRGSVGHIDAEDKGMVPGGA